MENKGRYYAVRCKACIY